MLHMVELIINSMLTVSLLAKSSNPLFTHKKARLIYICKWARPDFIIGVIKSKMECVNPIAIVTAKHPLYLRFLGFIFKFTRHVWKTAIDEECRNYSE